jgi:hypothetical protein
MGKGQNEHLSIHKADESAMTSEDKRTRFRSPLAVGLILISVIAAMWYLGDHPISSWDFRNNLWFPSRLLLDGRSPYRVDLLTDLGNAVWMPAIIGIGFPLGWLDVTTASNLWFLISLAALSILIGVLAVKWRPSVANVAVVAVMVTAFLPTLTHLRLGQFTILATLLYLLVAFWKDRLPLPVAALMLALALSKPQLGILALPGLILAYYRDDGRKRALQLVGLLCFWIVVLAVPLFFGSSNWIEDYIAALRSNPSWAHPSMWFLVPSWLGPGGLWLWGIVALVISLAAFRLWLTRDVEEAIVWSLALTPLVTPYVWSWDFVMVLPLFAVTAMRSRNKLQLAILVFGYLVCWLIAWRILESNPNNVRYWWIPWYMILLALGASFAGEMYWKRGAQELL